MVEEKVCGESYGMCMLGSHCFKTDYASKI